MILDALTEVSAAQALTASAASTSHYDAVGSIRVGGIKFKFRIYDVEGGDTTLSIAIQGSVDAAFTAPVEVATGVPAVAEGAKPLDFYILAAPRKQLRYYRAYYTLAGTDTPKAKVDADVVIDEQANYQAP